MAVSTLNNDLARKYYRQMQASYNVRSSLPTDTTPHFSAPSVSSPPAFSGTRPWAPATHPHASTPGAAHRKSPSGWRRLLDIISQPEYAVAQSVAETLKVASKHGPLAAFLYSHDPIEQTKNLGSGNEKQTTADIFRGKSFDVGQTTGPNPGRVTYQLKGGRAFLAPNKHDNLAQRIGKGAAGLGVDIASDPLSYVTLGGAGAATKLGGTALKGLGAAKAGEHVITAGEGLVRADAAINRGIEKAIAAPIKGVRAITGRSATTKAAKEAARASGVDTSLAPTIVPTDTGRVFKGQGSRVFESPSASTEIGLRDPLSHQAVPNTLANQTAKFTPDYSPKLGRVTEPTGAPLTPFVSHITEGKAPKSTGVAIDTVLSSKKPAVIPAPIKAAPKPRPRDEILANYTSPTKGDEVYGPLVAKMEAAGADLTNTREFNRIFTRSKTAESIKITATAKNAAGETIVTQTRPVSEWLHIASRAQRGDPLPQAESDLLKSAMQAMPKVHQDVFKNVERIMTDRSNYVNAAREADLTAHAVGVPVPVSRPGPILKAQTPKAMAEAAQRAAKPSETLADTQWALKPQGERDLIRKRWQRLLEGEHFEYLYDDAYFKNKDLTVTEKAKEFDKRAREIMRGRPTTRAKYEAFTVQRASHLPPEPNGETVARWANPGTPNDALGEAVGGVKPASEIINEVDGSMSETMARQAQAVHSASGLDLTDADKYILQRALGSNVGRAKGQGWNKAEISLSRQAYNAKAQGVVIQQYLQQFGREAGQLGLRGYERSQYMQAHILPAIQRVEHFLRANGVEPVAGNGSRGIPVSFGDMVDALSQSRMGRDFLHRRIFSQYGITKTKGIAEPGTLYADALIRTTGPIVDMLSSPAVIDAFRNGDDVYATVTSALQKIISEGRTPSEEQIAKVIMDESGHIRNAKGAVDVGPKGEPYYGPYSKNVVQEYMDVLFRGQLRENVAALETGQVVGHVAIPDVRVAARMAQIIQDRSAAHGIQFGDSVRTLSHDAMDRVYSVVSDGTNGVQLRDYLANIDQVVKNAERDSAVKYPRNIGPAATKRVREDVTDIVPPTDIAQAGHMNKIAEEIYPDIAHVPGSAIQLWEKPPVKQPIADGARERITQTMMEGHQSALDDIAREATDPSTLEQLLAERLDRSSFWRRVGIKTNNAFVPHGQFPDLHSAFLSTGSLSRWLSEKVRVDLTAISKMGSRDEIKQAYKLLQSGSRLGDPKLIAIKDELAKVNGLFWSGADDGGTYGILSNFLEQGYELRHVVDKMAGRHYGFIDAQKFKPSRGFWDAPIPDQTREFLKHLSSAHIEDPIDYLARVDAVMSSVARDTAFSQQAFKDLGAMGALSKVPKEGFTRISPESIKSNLVLRYWPGASDIYIDKIIATQLHAVDYMMKASVNPSGDFGGFMRSIDPFLAMWKSGMTIWRPGHHIRNMIGDMSLAFLMDGVKDPFLYYKAARLVGQRRAYEGADISRMLQGLEHRPSLLEASKKTNIIKFQGKKLQLSDQEVYDGLQRHGMFKTFSMGEDIISATDTPEWITKIQHSIQLKGAARGKARQAVGTVSEMRDDMVRMAHALHLLKTGRITPRLGLKRAPDKFENIDEFFKSVVDRVNQAHPDGSDLSVFERKYMRRIMPFYSWTRKAIPLVLEGALMHPGRITVFPKAMYNFSQQFGVNPDSLSDPFPTDQLFPSYMQDTLTGPIAKGANQNYYGIAPGVADQDVLNMIIGGGPEGFGNEMINMVNPMIKTPFEVMAGKTLTTPGGTNQGISTPGSRPAQYIGSQIPVVSQAQSISGYDILGSIGNAQPTPIESVTKGNRSQFGTLQALNWLLGGSIQDMTTPSGQRTADMQARDKARANAGG